MHAGARGPDGVLGVQRVRQRDIDRVDAFEAGIVLVVAVGAFDAILLPDLAALGPIVADQRDQTRVALGVPKGRKNGNLCDVAEADDSVADRSAAFRHAALYHGSEIVRPETA